MKTDEKQAAFLLRITPSGVDKVPEALRENQLIIGWAYAKGLLDPKLTWDEFREIISKAYYSEEPTMLRAGVAAGNMWRFVREMKVGDLVVVPHGRLFYVARITGPATYDPERSEDDTSYRRMAKREKANLA